MNSVINNNKGFCDVILFLSKTCLNPILKLLFKIYLLLFMVFILAQSPNFVQVHKQESSPRLSGRYSSLGNKTCASRIIYPVIIYS